MLALGSHAVGLVLGLSYEELSSDEDDNTTINHGGLGIKSRDLVLDLLKRKRLCQIQVSISAGGAPFGCGQLTVSFSTIAVAPRTEADSNVSIDCSR